MGEDFDINQLRIILVTRRALVIAILLILAGLALVSVVVIPQAQTVMSLYDDMESEKPELEKLERKLQELEDIEISPEYAQVEVVQEALPSKKPLLELMVALNNVSQETGTNVTDFELSPGLVATDSTQVKDTSQGNTGFDQLSLDLTVQGTFEEIQEFLLKVEEVAPFTTIVNMEIGNQINANVPGFDADTDPTFQAVLTTETYFFTQPISARVNSPLPKIQDREIEVLDSLAGFQPTDLPEQTEIRGGGLEDLFQLDPTLGRELQQEIDNLDESGL